jgi:hypothetical protein
MHANLAADVRGRHSARAPSLRTAPAFDPPARRPASARRSTGDRLREALLALGDFRGEVITHTEKAWASITFSGSRHSLALLFAGEEAVEAGERFIAGLPDHEFAIAGQLVADATVTEAEHRLLPTARLVVQCELLLLEEG